MSQIKLYDAHCHPFDLLVHLSREEIEPCMKGTVCAASAWNQESFEFHESLVQKNHGTSIILCFAVHPQFPASPQTPVFLTGNEYSINNVAYIENILLPLLEKLAEEKRLHAVGETGFDLFNEKFRDTEKIQDKIFEHHLGIALKYNLPMVLHARKAMHKIFPYTQKLKKIPAVIFHSWPGTVGEGEGMLRQGVNAFFSFGAAIVNNHKQAQKCCAAFPLDRLLFETDAPYMPPRGKAFSCWTDLPLIYKTASDMRGGLELEAIVEENFARAFGKKL